MNNLQSFNSYTTAANEARFNFGKTVDSEEKSRDQMVKKRRELLQKISAIKHELAHTKTPKMTPIMDMVDDVEVPVEATDDTTGELKAQLESLRAELRTLNKLLS